MIREQLSRLPDPPLPLLGVVTRVARTFAAHSSGFPKESAPRYLIRDRDGIYGAQVHRWLASLNSAEVVAAPRLSQQNPFVERLKHLIGSIRRGLLDHIIVLGERYLYRLLPSYFAYYHWACPHMGLGHNCPEPRAVETPECGRVVPEPMTDGLHHRYLRGT